MKQQADNTTHFIYNLDEKHRDDIYNFFINIISKGESSIEKILAGALLAEEMPFWSELVYEIKKDCLAACEFIGFLVKWHKANNERKKQMKNSIIKPLPGQKRR